MHGLIECIQITRRRVDFNGDSAEKSLGLSEHGPHFVRARHLAFEVTTREGNGLKVHLQWNSKPERAVVSDNVETLNLGR